MPPLDADRLEAVTHHGFTQDVAMTNLFLGEALGIIEVRRFAKQVIGATHVYLSFGLHVEEGEING